MPRRSKALADALESSCAITRSLGVLSDPWSFLLLREALLGRRTFAEFHEGLGNHERNNGLVILLQALFFFFKKKN